MQLKINHRLNQLLLLILASNIIVIGGLLIFSFDFLMANLLVIAVLIFLFNTIATMLFKMLENNWDKRIIQKMAIEGQIALANITKAEKYTALRDSGFRHYNIWQLNVVYWSQDMKRNEAVLFDKFNPEVEFIPPGTIYITNDDSKPLNRFVLQNVIISNIPSLQPLINRYESNKKINIKYLNVYYNNGLIIETFKQSLKAAKE